MTHEPFVGCSGYPTCTYIERQEKTRIDYVCESLGVDWRPNLYGNAESIIERCASHPEIKYLLGAAYFLDTKHNEANEPLRLYGDKIIYCQQSYDAIRFHEPFMYWGSGFLP